MGTDSGPMFWFFVSIAHSPSLQSGEADCSDVSSALHDVGLSGVKNTRPSFKVGVLDYGSGLGGLVDFIAHRVGRVHAAWALKH